LKVGIFSNCTFGKGDEFWVCFGIIGDDHQQRLVQHVGTSSTPRMVISISNTCWNASCLYLLDWCIPPLSRYPGSYQVQTRFVPGGSYQTGGVHTWGSYQSQLLKKTGSGEALASFQHVQRVHQPIVPPSQSSGLTHLTSQAHFDLTGNRSQTQAIVAKDAALLAPGMKSVTPHSLAMPVVHIGFHLNPDVFSFPISVYGYFVPFPRLRIMLFMRSLKLTSLLFNWIISLYVFSKANFILLT
jgi:hypothetical protein